MGSGAGHTTCLVRGSPIRKSSDQRSVDSSPRLIAASYVLHRLLVPRHPPCALNNLTPHHTHAHPPPAHTPAGRAHRRDGSARTCRYLPRQKNLARCSRPLCSSQATTRRSASPTASPHPAPTNQQRTTGRAVRRARSPPRDNTPPPHRGPARSLRTQQRAHHHQPPPTPALPPPLINQTSRAVLAAVTRSPAELVSVPPSSSVTNTGTH